MNEFERRALDIAQNSSYLAAYARKGRDIIDVEYFTYVAETTSIAANGGTLQSTIQIQSDSDFVMSYMSANAISAAGVITSTPNITVQITDTGSGKTLFSAPAQLSLAFGSQGFPYLLPAPRVFAPNTNVKFDFTNRDAATAYTINYFLSGARIYYA